MNHPHTPTFLHVFELLKWLLAALIVFGWLLLMAMFCYGRLWAILPALSLCYIAAAPLIAWAGCLRCFTQLKNNSLTHF